MRETKFETLTTPYAEKLDVSSPWNVYPRPQMQRDSFLSLNGEWSFAAKRGEDMPSEYTKKIVVPFPPESKLSGIEEFICPRKFLFYERKFTIPEGFIKDRVILHFGAVDQIADVYINGTHAVHNEGGYLPFSADITELLKPEGEQTITVRASDPLSHDYGWGKQKIERGGMWYTPVSGIWQTVWIESIPESPIESIKIHQTKDFAKIDIKCAAENKILFIEETNERIEFTADSVVYTPKEPQRWSPESPYLYHFRLSTKTDEVRGYFALREIGISTIGGKERLTLNGEPYFFSGLLDQGYFPDGIFLPATPEGYENDILTARSLGFNMLRKHIKIEPLTFYYFCDLYGMVVFQDMVNNSDYSFFLDTALPTVGLKKLLIPRKRSAAARAHFEEQMLKTAEHLYSCPSVLQYTIFNEGWGQFEADRMYSLLKREVPDKILDATSGWFREKLSDVDSHHIYFKIPTFKKTNGRPLFLSEFGGYSLRCDGHLFGSKNYGYKIYRSEEEFTEAFRELYEKGVIPKIRESGLCATVYTQLSDVEDETNGLMTYDRRLVKIDADVVKNINEKIYSEIKNLNE